MNFAKRTQEVFCYQQRERLRTLLNISAELRTCRVRIGQDLARHVGCLFSRISNEMFFDTSQKRSTKTQGLTYLHRFLPSQPAGEENGSAPSAY